MKKFMITAIVMAFMITTATGVKDVNAEEVTNEETTSVQTTVAKGFYFDRTEYKNEFVDDEIVVVTDAKRILTPEDFPEFAVKECKKAYIDSEGNCVWEIILVETGREKVLDACEALNGRIDLIRWYPNEYMYIDPIETTTIADSTTVRNEESTIKPTDAGNIDASMKSPKTGYNETILLTIIAAFLGLAVVSVKAMKNER